MSATLAPLPGDASAVRSYGKRYEGVAERILEVSRALESLVSSERSQGDSIDALKENGRATVGAIRTAQPRYHETALALVEFSVDLADAQQRASSAISDEHSGQTELTNLHNRRRRREEDRLDAIMAGEAEDELERIQRDIRHLDNEIEQIEYAVSQATNRYHQAVADREKAILEAIGRIRPALDQLNDSLLDYVRGAFTSLVEFAEAVANWVGTILTKIINALVTLVLVLVILVLVVILILVLVALLWAISPFLGAIVLATIIVAVIAVVAIIAALVVRSVYRETTAPTPEVKRLSDVPGGFERKGTIEDPDGDHREGNYENIFNNNQKIDDMGGAEATDVEIVTVRDDAGNIVGYRVVLPSTQDWEELNGVFNKGEGPQGDQGAYNDLGSNVALLAMPIEMRGPYQKAVMEALMQQMHEDGFSSYNEVPVMMAGFSQGGILAARMAADPNSPFNITAVVTGGSCIDTFPIPPNVSVLAIQHPDDPVPMLDGNVIGNNNTGWGVVDPLNPNQATVTAVKEADTDAHGANSYSQTAYEVLDHPVNGHVQSIVDQQSMFFSDNESVSVYESHE